MCDGSYKQYVVSPERYTTLIPDNVNDYIAGKKTHTRPHLQFQNLHL
jgi:hypothetical protein